MSTWHSKIISFLYPFRSLRPFSVTNINMNLVIYALVDISTVTLKFYFMNDLISKNLLQRYSKLNINLIHL